MLSLLLLLLLAVGTAKEEACAGKKGRHCDVGGIFLAIPGGDGSNAVVELAQA